MGNAAVTRMAREDTRWFIVGVVILSLVLFLALPMTMLIAVDHLKIKAEVRAEVQELRKLKKEMKRNNDERTNSKVDGQTTDDSR